MTLPKLKIFSLIIGLLLIFSLCLPFLALAQAEGEGEGEGEGEEIPVPGEGEGEGEGEEAPAPDVIQDRTQADEDQTMMEALRTDELQRRDYDQCAAEAGGSPVSPGPTGGYEDPNALQTADEQATREALAEAGYRVNNDMIVMG